MGGGGPGRCGHVGGGNWVTGMVTATVRKGRDIAIGPVASIDVSVELCPGPSLVTGPQTSWPLEDLTVKILAEATVDRAVVLRDLRVLVDARRRPPDGMEAVPAAALPARRFLIDLDQDHPRPVPEAGTPAFPYTVSPADPEQFVVTASTRRHDVQWRLAFDWICLGQRGTKVIDYHGRPFRVVARPERL